MLVRMDWRLGRRTELTPRAGGHSLPVILLGLAAILLACWIVYRHALQPPWSATTPGFLLDSLTLLEWAAAVTLLFMGGMLLWQRRRREQDNLSVSDLYALSPAEFEAYVARLFRQKGYTVRLRGGSGDHGVDLELQHPNGRRAIVQCKRYRKAIGPEVVRELLGTMIHEQVQHAFLVTTASISPAAREWARFKPMTLIDGQTLVELAAALTPDGR